MSIYCHYVNRVYQAWQYFISVGENILLNLEGSLSPDNPPEPCDGYFHQISCEHECLSVLANQSQER